jgi:hypothetical protein
MGSHASKRIHMQFKSNPQITIAVGNLHMDDENQDEKCPLIAVNFIRALY